MTDIQIFYDGPIVKRAEAKARGLKRYFTGKPCKYGHVAERYFSGNCAQCVKENSEKMSEYAFKYRKDNPEKEKERCRKYREKNKEKRQEYYRKWQKENPKKVMAIQRTRRARKANSEGRNTYGDVLKILTRQNHKCAEPTCGVDLSDGYHVDHIMPISKGGSNWPSNLQCLCPTCNLSKSDKMPHVWAQEKGRLL